MKAYLTMAALCGAALALPAQAQTWQQIEARYTPQFESCMDAVDPARGSMDVAMAQCMAQETLRQDARRTSVFNVTLTSLQSQQKGNLTADERKWNAQRETVCHEQSSALAGETKKQLAFAECMLDATIRRAIWLETYRP